MSHHLLRYRWRAGNPAEQLRQKQELRKDLLRRVEASKEQIGERKENAMQMEAYATEVQHPSARAKWQYADTFHE